MRCQKVCARGLSELMELRVCLDTAQRHAEAVSDLFAESGAHPCPPSSPTRAGLADDIILTLWENGLRL